MNMFDDLDTDPMLSTSKEEIKREEIRQNAHIANGGEASFPCPGCKGTGRFVSYTGRVVGNCFKCKGAGKVGKRVVAAAQAKVTRANNLADKQDAFRTDFAAEYEFIQRNSEWSSFYRNMADAVATYGSLTDNQIAAVRKGMVQAAEKKAEKAEARAANSAEVNVSAIEQLFNTARESGLKKLKFRTERMDISVAPETGRNAGSLYVTFDGQYAGKITSGKYLATNAATAETLPLLLAIAADPAGQARLYGKQTGKCGCCGRELTDPTSIEMGIGPICADNWGL